MASRAQNWHVSICRDWAEAAPVFDALAREGNALPFQRKAWLGPWYASRRNCTDITPMPVLVHDGDQRLVMALPLVLQNRRIHFVDAGLTDYNAPIIGEGAPQDQANAVACFKALRTALPAADLIDFSKMPAQVGTQKNPLTLLPAATLSTLSGNAMTLPEDWDTWHWALPRTFRKELERSWRVFSRCEGAEFRQIHDPQQALRIYADMARMQRRRIMELGLPYILDTAENAEFYEDFAKTQLQSGAAILTTLTVGDETVAALLAIGDGSHVCMLRLATARGQWLRVSPGRLVIERSMHALHQQGYRTFDFTIGDYDYKRRLGAERTALYDLRVPLSWRGIAPSVLHKAKAAVRTSPKLMRLANKLRGRNDAD